MSDQKNSTHAKDTGHTWDDNLRELTNQPPRWWMISFYLSLAWVVVYFVLFPALPLANSYTKGILDWTQMKEFQGDLAELEKIRAPFETRIAKMPVSAILGDKELSNYSVQSAKVLFGDRCAPCHGNGGAGNPGFPVLADDDWLFGGKIEQIHQSIMNGRRGSMPGFATNSTPAEIDLLAQHVLALSEGGSNPVGRNLFVNKGCAGCHGMDGKGLEMMGSANLTDKIWRFSPVTKDSVKHTISHGVNNAMDKNTRNAVMPSFAQQLSDAEIKKLAVYVHQLGGGK
ncbi:MAG: cytochrome-c oxidase, cbb3-type subunit III [Gammaproteobacteria bacterium]|nr:cytochrome-c oxidase, cbb3-type subunit III [Gammaproteobacteria bacterium]MDH5729310.1 cytochrome-c oxidase, cbb3-type subunit III [Gammaproteobacteria bacterium]